MKAALKAPHQIIEQIVYHLILCVVDYLILWQIVTCLVPHTNYRWLRMWGNLYLFDPILVHCSKICITLTQQEPCFLLRSS